MIDIPPERKSNDVYNLPGEGTASPFPPTFIPSQVLEF